MSGYLVQRIASFETVELRAALVTTAGEGVAVVAQIHSVLRQENPVSRCDFADPARAGGSRHDAITRRFVSLK